MNDVDDKQILLQLRMVIKITNTQTNLFSSLCGVCMMAGGALPRICICGTLSCLINISCKQSASLASNVLSCRVFVTP